MGSSSSVPSQVDLILEPTIKSYLQEEENLYAKLLTTDNPTIQARMRFVQKELDGAENSGTLKRLGLKRDESLALYTRGKIRGGDVSYPAEFTWNNAIIKCNVDLLSQPMKVQVDGTEYVFSTYEQQDSPLVQVSNTNTANGQAYLTVHTNGGSLVFKVQIDKLTESDRVLVERIKATGNVSSGGRQRKYENLTVNELKAKCKSRKLKYSGLRKAELIALLRKK